MMMLFCKHIYKMVVVSNGRVSWWIIRVIFPCFLTSEVIGVIPNGDNIRITHTTETGGIKSGNSSLDYPNMANVTDEMQNKDVINENISNLTTYGSTVTPAFGKAAMIETSTSPSKASFPREYSLPRGWSDFCVVVKNETYESLFTPKVNMTSIKCLVGAKHSGLLTMVDLRENALEHKDLNLSLSVEIECESMANISFSFPYKVTNLIKLTIKDCTVLDFLAEKDSKYLTSISDSLRVIRMRNNKCLVRLSRFANTTSNIKSVQKAYDCVQETTIEEMSNRNISFDFIIDDEYILTQIIEHGVQYLQDTLRVEHECDFKHLLTMDESFSTVRSLYHSDLMAENSFYNELRVYNVSNTYIQVLGDRYLKWSRKFPKLEMLDLSQNNISKLYRFTVPLRTDMDVITTVNLRFNKISSISISDLELFKTMPMVFYDLRNNSMDCNCSDTLVELVRYIQDGKHLLLSKFSDYSYIGDLECQNPENLAGVPLKSLSSEMICESTMQTEYFIVPIICLSAAIIILAAILIMVMKFRQEIVIILFTRFHIIIPCQTMEDYDSGKKYDAFVSYSSNEEEYVEKLFEDLEKQADDNSRPAFKFCMHHRDFVPGKTIFDNVSYSVESSRHTIILLSNHFLKSEFCLYEFQEAFRQSIMEKRRHLLIIMMEDIPEEKLPRDLRRCVKTFTYIRKDDYLFNERLIYALSIKNKGKTVVDNSKSKVTSSKNKLSKSKLPVASGKIISKETSLCDSKRQKAKSENDTSKDSNINSALHQPISQNGTVQCANLEQNQHKYKKKGFEQNGDKLTISTKRVNDYNLSPIERKLNNKDLEYDRSLSIISQDTGYGSERGSICGSERLSPEVAVDMEDFPPNEVIC